MRQIAWVALAFLTLFAGALPAAAQSTNAPLDLVVTTKPFDPSTLTLSDSDKTIVTNYLSAVKTQTSNSVLTIGTNLANASYYFGSTSDPGTVADIARVAMELCEYNIHGPCLILAINGMDARAADGGWPPQPQMLASEPGSHFSPWTIPFNTQHNRGFAYGLATTTSPFAIVVSTGAGWSSSGGKTELEAVDGAYATCAKTYPNNVCVLYSVNNVVVFRP